MRDGPFVVVHVVRTAVTAVAALVKTGVDGQRPFVVDLEGAGVQVLVVDEVVDIDLHLRWADVRDGAVHVLYGKTHNAALRSPTGRDRSSRQGAGACGESGCHVFSHGDEKAAEGLKPSTAAIQ